MASRRSAALTDEAARCWRQGELTRAEALAKQALSRDAKDVNAWQVLGLIDKQRGWFDQAAQHFERCVRLRGDDPMSHCRLASVRMLQGRFPDAIAGYDRALLIDADHLTAIRGKAEVLERGGDLDGAYEVLAPAAERHAKHAETALLFALLKVKRGQPEQAIALLEPFVSREDVQAVTRRQMSFVAGRACDRLERFDDAFANYEKANALAARPFDLRAKIRRTDRMLAFFAPQRLATLPRAEEPSERPVFIVGMPRSGSTLVEQIIDAHRQAYGAGELTAFNEVVAAIAGPHGEAGAYPEAIESLGAAALRRLARRYVNRVARLRRDAARVADKNLLNYNHLGLIALLYPNARVIHCRRDPLDVGISCFINDLSPVGFPWSGNLRNIGLYYRQYERLMSHWRRVLDLAMLELRYEEVVDDPEPAIRRIIAFCGLPWDEACLRFHQSGRAVTTLSYDQVRQPVYRTAVKRHERYAGHLGPLREALGSAE